MLLRIARPLATGFAILVMVPSWVSTGLFLFLAIRRQLHALGGWPGSATEHQLLLVMILALFHSALLVLLMVGLKMSPGRGDADETRWWMRVHLGSAVIYALIAGWCQTALQGSQSALLFGVISLGMLATIILIVDHELRPLFRKMAAFRRARAS